MILQALQKGDFSTVASLGHNMKGAGSSWGFPPITEIGAALEQAGNAADTDAVRLWVGRLSNYLARIEIVAD